LKILDFRLTEAAIKAASLNGQLIRFPNLQPEISFTKIARMPRALHGDEWHPLIPSPLGERVRVRGGKVMGIHPHLNPPPQGGGDIF